MFCMNCGAKQPDNSVFCGSCGTRLNGPESVETEKQAHQDQMGQTNSIHQMTQEMKNQVDAVDKQQVSTLCLVAVEVYKMLHLCGNKVWGY